MDDLGSVKFSRDEVISKIKYSNCRCSKCANLMSCYFVFDEDSDIKKFGEGCIYFCKKYVKTSGI